MSKNPLVGNTVMAVWLADDKQAIKFDLSDGKSIIARAYGDCCSHTWIENVDLPENCIGSQVVSADDLDGLPEPSLNHSEHECLAFYGFKIVTGKGETKIDYRNSSNGYYGGSLCWPDESYYGGVYGQNNTNEKWVKLA